MASYKERRKQNINLESSQNRIQLKMENYLEKIDKVKLSLNILHHNAVIGEQTVKNKV